MCGCKQCFSPLSQLSHVALFLPSMASLEACRFIPTYYPVYEHSKSLILLQNTVCLVEMQQIPILSSVVLNK